MQITQTFSRAALITVLAVVLVCLSALTALSVLAGPGDNGEAPPKRVVVEEGRVTWEEVQRLQNEQKFEAAFDVVEAIRLHLPISVEEAEKRAIELLRSIPTIPLWMSLSAALRNRVAI